MSAEQAKELLDRLRVIEETLIIENEFARRAMYSGAVRLRPSTISELQAEAEKIKAQLKELGAEPKISVQ